MAEPFETRAKIALESPRFRLSDFPALIEEGEALADEQRSIAAEAAAESVDFALTEEARDTAADRAERARRNATAMGAAVEALSAKYEERRSSDKAKAREAEQAAAKAERDEIAKRFDAIVRPAIDAIAELLGETDTNAARMKQAGLREPDAEAVARGVRGWNVKWYRDLQIPAFDGQGRAWPPQKKRIDVHRSAVDSARQIAATKAAELEGRWGRYKLTVGDVTDVIGGVSFKARISSDSHAERVETIFDQSWEGEIAHSEAELLRKRGVIVEALAIEMAE
jgi:hypothetical protein